MIFVIITLLTSSTSLDRYTHPLSRKRSIDNESKFVSTSENVKLSGVLSKICITPYYLFPQ